MPEQCFLYFRSDGFAHYSVSHNKGKVNTSDLIKQTLLKNIFKKYLLKNLQIKKQYISFAAMKKGSQGFSIDRAIIDKIPVLREKGINVSQLVNKFLEGLLKKHKIK